jgi:hypothetical protein
VNTTTAGIVTVTLAQFGPGVYRANARVAPCQPTKQQWPVSQCYQRDCEHNQLASQVTVASQVAACLKTIYSCT